MNTVLERPTADEPAASVPIARVPPVPTSLREAGLSQEMLIELILKTLYVQGARTGQQLADAICLPFELLDQQLLTLQHRRFVEVKGTGGAGRVGYVFDVVGTGRDRARDALEASQYVGPAPVPLNHYRWWIERQTIRDVHVTRERIAEGFRSMVLDAETLEMLGPAINSAKSLFLHGDSGNGKTMIAECIAGMLGGAIYVPYAVEVDGQIVVVYDPVYHHPVAEPAGEPGGAGSIWRLQEQEHDRRFAKVRRPVVLAGGELTLEQLDLQYDPYTKMYQAPFQVKSNGGVLIIDDFGRQRVPPRDLLNRWIVPLEKRIDFLTLHTGSKFPVPFDCLLIFATNLDPQALVEEAFLRRIHYKVNVDSPTPAQYVEIFRRCCAARGLPFDEAAVERVYSEFYAKRGIHPRACHPRDIVDHVCDVARYLEVPPVLSPSLIDRACHSFFLEAEAH